MVKIQFNNHIHQCFYYLFFLYKLHNLNSIMDQLRVVIK